MAGYILTIIAILILIPLTFLALRMFSRPAKSVRPREDEKKGTTRSQPTAWEANADPEGAIRKNHSMPPGKEQNAVHQESPRK